MAFPKAKANAIRSSTLGASLLSCLLHATAFVLLAMLAGQETSPSQIEADRRIEIVVAPASRVGPTRYFDGAADVSSTPGHSKTPDDPLSTANNGDSAINLAASSAAPVPAAALDPLLSDSRSGIRVDSAFDFSRMGVGGRGSAGRGRIMAEGDDVKALEAERERLRKREPSFPPAQVSLFGGPASAGRSFIFLIDRSKSMSSDGMNAIDLSRRELNTALAALQPEHQFQVIAYNFKTLFVNERRMLPATEENRRQADAFLSALGGFGATQHDMALQTAIQFNPDVVYLLTDGGDPYLNEFQLARIKQRTAGRTTIHCIQFGVGKPADDEDFLQRLARQNGGDFRFVDCSVK